MGIDRAAWAQLEKITWQHIALAIAVVLLARVVSFALRALIRRLAENASPHRRLSILRTMPFVRIATGIAALVAIIPIFVEPTFANAIAVIASLGLALAFAFKDYGSSLLAGLVTVVEKSYQPGDWIELGGVYGEVKSIELRATRIVTPDDTEVVVPNSRIWSGAVANATSGNRSMLCVAEFYLHPDHDAGGVRTHLALVAESSEYILAGKPVAVMVSEMPWGTKYRLKAYAKESRDQYAFVTDLTVRGRGVLRGSGVRFAQAPYAAGASA